MDTRDIVNNVLDPRYTPPNVASAYARWQVLDQRSEERFQPMQERRTNMDAELMRQGAENVQRLTELLAQGGRDLAEGNFDGPAVIGQALENSSTLGEIFESQRQLISNYAQTLGIVRDENRRLQSEVQQSRVQIHTLGAQVRGARGVGRVQSVKAETLAHVVNNLNDRYEKLTASHQVLKNDMRTAARFIDHYKSKAAYSGDMAISFIKSTQNLHDELKAEEARNQNLRDQIQILRTQVETLGVEALEGDVLEMQAEDVKVSVHGGLCKSFSNAQVRVGAEYLVNPANSEPSRFRWISHIDVGVNEPLRKDGVFLGVKGSKQKVSMEYEVAQINNRLFHSLKADHQVSPKILRAINSPVFNDAVGVGILTPVTRSLNPISAFRQAQIALTNRSFAANGIDAQLQQTVTLKHAKPKKVSNQQPVAPVRNVPVASASETVKQDFAQRQLVEPPKQVQASRNSDLASMGVTLMFGVWASLLMAGKLLRKFKKTKRAAQ